MDFEQNNVKARHLAYWWIQVRFTVKRFIIQIKTIDI
jgi:hypothetical protein